MRIDRHRMIASIALLLSVFYVSSSTLRANAQTNPSQGVDVTLHLSLIAKTMPQNGASILVWQLDLNAIGVTSADPDVTLRITSAIDSMKTEAATQNHPWVLRFGDRFDFFGKFTTVIGQSVPIISPAGFQRNPSAEGSTFAGN